MEHKNIGAISHLRANGARHDRLREGPPRKIRGNSHSLPLSLACAMHEQNGLTSSPGSYSVS